ncbi:MAG: Lrp/AsnC family transcriptional regulator [Candidatus Bathyarchaeia archaeon]
MKNQLDELDVAIIRALQKDARTNFADIAKSCNVSVDTISKRYRRLKKTGVARGATVLLNPKSFGYDCLASFGMRVDQTHVEEVARFIGKVPEVVFSTPCMGRHNVFAIAVLKNVGRLSQVKEYMQGHPMIHEVTASIWVDEILLCPENFEFDQQMEK